MFTDEFMGYGIADNRVTVEKKGVPLYDIIFSGDLIEISPVSAPDEKIGSKLEKFVEASLHEGR